MKKIFGIVCLLTFLLGSSILAHGFTRDDVIERDLLHCGVSTGIPGFSTVDGKGNWSGIDVDICRAVAAAVLGDAKKVEFIPLLPKERVTALLAGEVDILSRNFAWTLTRDTALPLHFAAVSFFDLQGFLVSEDNKVERILEMKEFSVCRQSGNNYGEYLKEYLQDSGVVYKSVVSETPDRIIKDFEAGRCEVVTGGRAQLQGIRSKMSNPARTRFLPEIIAKIPMGPAVRHGDDVWLDIVRWSVFALIQGEELGLTSANINTMKASPDQAIQHFIGVRGTGGKGLGLDNEWAFRIINQVGNYGEVFEKNLGEASPLKLKRGLNNLWNKGGIVFAPPVR